MLCSAGGDGLNSSIHALEPPKLRTTTASTTAPVRSAKARATERLLQRGAPAQHPPKKSSALEPSASHDNAATVMGGGFYAPTGAPLPQLPSLSDIPLRPEQRTAAANALMLAADQIGRTRKVPRTAAQRTAREETEAAGWVVLEEEADVSPPPEAAGLRAPPPMPGDAEEAKEIQRALLASVGVSCCQPKDSCEESSHVAFEVCL